MAGARANINASEKLKSISPGWAITALFYSAVHFMRAYLGARHGLQLASHDEMHRLWNAHPELRRVKAEYVHLKQVSEGFRYYLADYAPEDVDEIRPRLEKIKRTLEPWIEKALGDGPAARA